MTPKSSIHVIQGMQKDTSKSKVSKEFALHNHNIRITAREDNTLLSITNEKGTTNLNSLQGYYLGHCVLNNKLVLFLKLFLLSNPIDYIKLYDVSNNERTTLYEGSLNFQREYPIEALGVYENEDIQKVYWVDGINQPRVINIAASEEIRAKWNNNSFNFVPELALKETYSVEPINTSSNFASGVIQYAFSYYNKYGQESNIFETTPLQYIRHKNRGASPEEVVKDLGFRIEVNNLDTNFDFIRLYSIHRTSLDAVPTVKIVQDLEVKEYIEAEEEQSKEVNSYKFYEQDFDNIYVKKIDPVIQLNVPILDYIRRNDTQPEITNSLTYKYKLALSANESIIIQNDEGEDIQEITTTKSLTCIICKRIDNYLGNIVDYSCEIKHSDESHLTIKNIETKPEEPKPEYKCVFIDDGTTGEVIDPTQLLYIGGEDIVASTIASKDSVLFLGNIKLNRFSIPEEIKEHLLNHTVFGASTEKSETIASFKPGEHYRCGVQFQHKSGKWSEPIFLKDYTITALNANQIKVAGIEGINETIKELGYVKIRPLVVYPSFNDRKILAQGVLCPTVFHKENRENNAPYSQSSWFFRPSVVSSFEDYTSSLSKGSVVEYRHGNSIIGNKKPKGDDEVGDKNYLISKHWELQLETPPFVIDQSIITFHSPELEFNNDFFNLDTKNIKLQIVGIVPLIKSYGNISIQTDTPTILNDSKGSIPFKLDCSGGRHLLSGPFYEDRLPNDNTIDAKLKFFTIYPWQSSGSLSNDSENLTKNSRPVSNILKYKKLSNYLYADHNTYFDNNNQIWKADGNGHNKNEQENGINLQFFNGEPLIKIRNEKEDLNYYGNVDTIITGKSEMYVSDDFSSSSAYPSDELKRTSNIRMKYKSTPHAIIQLKTGLNGNKVILPILKGENLIREEKIVEVEDVNGYIEISYISPWQPANGETNEVWLRTPNLTDKNSGVMFTYINGAWKEFTLEDLEGNPSFSIEARYDNGDGSYSIYSAYAYALGHAVIWKYMRDYNPTSTIKTIPINQTRLDMEYYGPYLYLAELYRDEEVIQNAFGGDPKLCNNLWFPAGTSIDLDTLDTYQIIEWTAGDTWNQRYECLKTYAYTPEDENQIVEILSFYCQTRQNLLGRYDKNIENVYNLNADPTNFNLLNPVYSQKDNFFNYRSLDKDLYKVNDFKNTITWSKEKFNGEEIDTWTNINLAATLDLDGTKGPIEKLAIYKDTLLSFQDRCISEILYNKRTQIPVADGVPIEISNGKKVDGYRIITHDIGCKNKYSIQVTPSGVYFLDSNQLSIYLLSDGIKNLSTEKGFDIWTKEVANDPTFKTFYDKNNKDVYFNTDDYSLCYSEKLNNFTSFYDYNNVKTMFNIDDNFYSIYNNTHNGQPLVGDDAIYKMFDGDYNNFFGKTQPYSITFISNENPYIDKVFTNIEYQADVFDSNNTYLENESFDTLEVWNEYQHNKVSLDFSKYKPSFLKKRFRLWDITIPRDSVRKLDRMRNPWLYIKLSKEKPETYKMELHDIVVKYFE